MRKIYFLSLFLISLSVFPQGAPKQINYQGVARDVNGDPIFGPIAVKIDIHAANSNGPVVCSEVFHVTTNQFGIFDLRIGSMSPVQFNAIPWGAAKYFVGVALDPTGGNTFGADISNQELVSVPYALYAENSGNAGPSTTITSNFPSIVSVNSAPPSHTINYTPPQLKLSQDSILSIVQGAYTSTTVIFKLGGSTATLAPVSPWQSSVTNVFLVNGGYNVGIGTPTPAAKLEVSSNVASTNNAIGAYSQGGNGVLALTSSNSTLNAAVVANNNGSGPGVVASTGALNTNVAAVQGVNSGTGQGLVGRNSNVGNNSFAYGVLAETSSSSQSAAAVYASNLGQGMGVYAKTSSTSSAVSSIFGDNTNGDGVRGKTISSQTVAGVRGENFGVGAGVIGTHNVGSPNPQANGVRGETNSSSVLSAGVSGETFGTGSGVHGISATQGTAIRAQTIGTSTLGLWVDGGHIKSTQQGSLSIVTVTNSGGISSASYTCTTCTDVKGRLLAVATTTGMINVNGQLTISVGFAKGYSQIPTVVVSPANDFQGMTHYVTNVGNNGFQIVLVNKTAANIFVGSIPFNINYMVIE